MGRGFDYWRERIGKLGLPEMPIREAKRARGYDLTRSRNQLYFMAPKLLQFLFHTSFKTLAEAGLPFESALQMKLGEMPLNIDVMMKTPVEFGGTVEFPNLLVIRKYPFRDILAEFFSEQRAGGEENLWVPDCDGNVFLSALRDFAGGGGNATDDRVTEAGMNVAGEAAAAMQAAIAAKAGKNNG